MYDGWRESCMAVSTKGGWRQINRWGAFRTAFAASVSRTAYLSGMGKLLVLIVALAIVYYIGKEVVGAFRHLSDEDLADYWADRVKKNNIKAFRRMSEHLGSCDKCRDRLDQIRQTEAGPGADAPFIERKY